MQTVMVRSEVPSAVAASRPASAQSAAMEEAMAERKMRPTSYMHGWRIERRIHAHMGLHGR